MKLTDTIPIHIYNIKWDIDEEDKDKETPTTDLIQIFTGYELMNSAGKHDPNTGDFEITDDEIGEFISDWLSDEFEFCHLGFEWDYASCSSADNPYHLTSKDVLKLIGLLGNLQDSIQDDIEYSNLKPSMEVIVAKDRAQDFLKQIIGDNFFNVDYTIMANS